MLCILLQLLRRLVGGGLTEENISQLLLMREHLTRLQRQKKATEATRSNISLNQQPQKGIVSTIPFVFL